MLIFMYILVSGWLVVELKLSVFFVHTVCTACWSKSLNCSYGAMEMETVFFICCTGSLALKAKLEQLRLPLITDIILSMGTNLWSPLQMNSLKMQFCSRQNHFKIPAIYCLCLFRYIFVNWEERKKIKTQVVEI